MSETPLPPSLAVKPNIPYSEQTIEQLIAEHDYWATELDAATGWGSWLSFASECTAACDYWLKVRRGEQRC